MRDRPRRRPKKDRSRVTLRHRFEYTAVRAFAALATLFGVRWAYFVARCGGRLIHALDGAHRRTARENLRRYFRHEDGTAPDEAEVRRIARGAFVSFVCTAVETLLLAREVARRPLDEIIEIEGAEHLEAAGAGGRPVVFVTAHLGNWEVAGLPFQRMGHELVSVYRPMDNPLLDRWVRSLRGGSGLEPLPKKGAIRGLLRGLKEGRWVVLLVDQHAGRKGIMAPFFGVPVSTIPTPAELALRTGAAVVTGFCVRTGPGFRFRMWFDPPVEGMSGGPREAEVLRLTTELNRRLGVAVRRHPEQWLWAHRRFRSAEREPVGGLRDDSATGSARQGS